MHSVFNEPTLNVCSRLPLSAKTKLNELCRQLGRHQASVIAELIAQAEVTNLQAVRLRPVAGTGDAGEIR